MMNPKWQIRKGGVHNADYESYIRSKPCIICGRTPVDLHHCFHVRSSPYFGMPLCREHHTGGPCSYHALEHEAFEKRHKINLYEELFKLLVEYLEK